ncbi:HSP20-like chaperones superfamily protein [Hirschfeldia incana]|nr:HSP20-like chaperones superfamily protein [Hirschfeldia incana]
MANFGAERVYQEFEPATRWTTEPDAEVLVADLPGFKKEQVKVSVTSTRKLRLTGERPTGGNKWIRFHKDIPVPMTVDIDSVSAMFKDYKLYIRHPKVKPETPQTKPPPAQVKPPVVTKPHDQQHDAKQGQGSKPNDQLKHDARKKAEEAKSGKEGLASEPKGPMSSKDEEKDKVGAKWFEKYREATRNVVKDAKSKRQLLCNLTASIVLVLLILLYARNAVRSSLVWTSEE